MSKKLFKTLIWVTIYSIAMAFLETSVVVYLRKLYYPGGFNFPLRTMDNDIVFTELIREIATVVMILSVSYIAGRSVINRFAYFIISFAVWDIFYYVFLKLLLSWPASFMTWDILFLIPVTWVGPVIAPLICSLLMIALGCLILYYDEKNAAAKIYRHEWLLLIAGSIVVIFSFIWDYLKFMHQYYLWKEIISYDWYSNAVSLSKEYVPQEFNWWVFMLGIAIISSGIVLFSLSNRKLILK